MKYIWVLLICCSFNLFAQQPDSVVFKPRTEQNFSNPKKLQAYIVPAAFISYGLVSLGDNFIRDLDLSTKNELTEDHPLFAARLDDYMKFAPILAMYGLNVIGVKARSSVLDQTAMFLLSTGITTVIVTELKKGSHRLRPDGSSYNSFPSGHAATAFAAAELLNQEFKAQTPWIGYAGYAIASATGILRMYNNRHWVSDVVAGAGFGMLSTKLTYLIYPYIKSLLGKKQNNLNIFPSYLNKQFGYQISYTLR